MKLTIIGAAGLRTPLIVEEIIRRQDRLHIQELCLMDIDEEHLQLIAAITTPVENDPGTKFKISRTTDSAAALKNADYVITTFRVGGIESRVIDERVALDLGFLGQETTGPGGFAMGLRSIPVLLQYIEQMRSLCPNAWLINFANPSGMLAEAVCEAGGWKRTVGICDGPSSMLEIIARLINIPVDQLSMEYFGLNHLGWIRAINFQQDNLVPTLIQMMQQFGSIPGFHIDSHLVASLGMIPNEYLYYYYHSRQAVQNILAAGETRGELVAKMNNAFFQSLRELREKEDYESMKTVHHDYIYQRGQTYMRNETGAKTDPEIQKVMDESADLGYANLALNLIEALVGGTPRHLVVNIPNQGAITGMNPQDVVEIPALISKDSVEPVSIGSVPDECLGLMKQVKAYEKLTIQAALEKSYRKAVAALAIHPLVSDYPSAEKLVNGYLQRHGDYFPKLS
jgi:6-phospho-beta-glucosidase